MSLRMIGFALPLVPLAAWPSPPAGVVIQQASAAVKEVSQDQEHAFDFLMGTWAVKNSFLAKRLAHAHRWLHFDAVDIERPLPTGTGNLEVYKTSFWSRFIGMSVRLYNPATRQWTLYWTDNRFSRGTLQPPVIGRFQDGYGVFVGKDHFHGIPILVRYTWRNPDRDHARWTQAFSVNGGRTWEVNWMMIFTRITETSHASSASRPHGTAFR